VGSAPREARGARTARSYRSRDAIARGIGFSITVANGSVSALAAAVERRRWAGRRMCDKDRQ
jgi:hypothetical protein